MPSAAVLSVKPELGLELTYGPENCRVRVVPKDERTLEYRVTATTTAGLPVAAHVTLIPHLGKPLETAAGQKVVLGEEADKLDAATSRRLGRPRGLSAASAAVCQPVLAGTAA